MSTTDPIGDRPTEDSSARETPGHHDGMIVELRHEAGLSAGNTMQLGQGRYEFGPSVGTHGGLDAGQPTVVGFELQILHLREILLVPRDSEIKLDGRPVNQPELVSPGQIIQSGADHFVLGSPDDFVTLARHRQPEIRVTRVTGPDLGPRAPLAWFWLGLIVLGLLLTFYVAKPWITLTIIGVVLGGLIWWWQYRQNQREVQAHGHALERANAQLVSEIAEARSMVARQCRAAHLSPVGVTTGATEIGSDDDRSRRTGRLNIAIGLGDIAWQPPVSARRSAGWDYESVVQDYASLTAVPYLLDLHAGPIALVGPARGIESMARYLTQATESISGQMLTVVPHTEDKLDRLDYPAVLLADSSTQVPAECQTVVIVDEAGFASVEDHQGEVLAVDLVPNGLPDFEQEASIHFMPLGPTELVEPGGPTELVEPGGPTELDENHEVNGSPADLALLMTAAETEASTRASGRFGGVRLYTSDNRAESKEFLASIGLELARRQQSNRLSITILDAGDRGLIRLRQLPHCVGYAAIDDDRGAKATLTSLSSALTQEEGRLQVILASEFPRLIAFLKLSGRQRLAEHLLALANQTDQDRLVMVASAVTEEPGDIPKGSAAGNITRAVARLVPQAS